VLVLPALLVLWLFKSTVLLVIFLAIIRALLKFTFGVDTEVHQFLIFLILFLPSNHITLSFLPARYFSSLVSQSCSSAGQRRVCRRFGAR